MSFVQNLNNLEEIILSKIQQKVTCRSTEENFMSKAFKYHDLTDSGWVGFEKFKKTLMQFVAGINDQDLGAIFDRYAQDGMLPYRQFCAEFVSGYRRQGGFEFASQEEEKGGQDGQYYEAAEDTLLRMKDYLYDNGPMCITNLAAAFRDADPQNLRSMHLEHFHMVLSEFFHETPCQVSDQQLEAIFDLFRQPHAPDQMAYDEFFLALKDELSPQRRSVIRQAFRRLDTGSEGLVDISKIISSFNANRHPQVSDGSRRPEAVLDEFATTLQEHIGFRRGMRSYPSNLIAWEEFEDYYQTVCGCFISDEQFCTTLEKVWDLNKVPNASVESRAALARPAAGTPAKSRAGLHHWQTNTLTTSATHHKVDVHTRIDDVLLRARTQIANKGLRAAVSVIQNFYAADDDVDDQLDVYEFRQSCQKSGIAFRDAEESSIFQACGAAANSGKLVIPKFLDLLHGELGAERRSLVERAFVRLGGDPSDPSTGVSPTSLKDNFAAQAHPLVVRGQLQAGFVLAEFLDSFSLLVHVTGGCENGMVSFADFLAYYKVVSSTVGNDTLFDLILQRVWDLPAQAQTGPKDAWGEVPPSPRRSQRADQQAQSPMERRKPPAHTGPSAYSRGLAFPPDASAQAPEAPVESHRRFSRSDVSGLPAHSPITKSSIVFNATGSGLDAVINRLRHSVGLRGLKGWMGLVRKFQEYDYRKNGTVMRLDWQRMNKILGLGLSPEEQDLMFKVLSASRKGAAMDYLETLRLLRDADTPPDREQAVEKLYQALQTDDGLVLAETLKSRFDAKSSPQCLLRRKDQMQADQEFVDVVDFFARGGAFDAQQFKDFFSMASAVHEDDDEFRLMTSRAFGVY
mmetsp:Transcript_42170/g.68310  ORF Transcript_42170/g.68310 Transcript_42170/m.68310 type:complete len:854 (-) Transcript_42170:89-2650(-)|eukprot:CAMPEP_0115125958 /NCGR_PEP_ID=MMETSP0227-20121206/49389_1 /TAXON_ID=89957 /ORGANISM="Polarella glacialis, Strain CCMP 1383" /LENGTH=853 /DNA_ID=CAMNT_0002529503 /DNA_START=55 /DNA_END=2616 /DNA_ORIENTATION=-